MRRSAAAKALTAGLATIALLAVSTAAGSTVPATSRLSRLPIPKGLDFGASPTRQLAPVEPSFIQRQLGFAPNAFSGTSPSSGAGVAKQYACVNGHQTDDPLSPPCNTSESITNAGATYQGVTSDEIRVAVVAYGNNEFPCGGSRWPPCSGQNTVAPYDTWFDLDKPESLNQVFARGTKYYADYFNARFQTYGRRVHLFLYFFDSAHYYAKEESKQQAKRIVDALHPFAAVIESQQFSESLSAELARRGVPAFTDLWSPAQRASYYAQYPSKVYGYWPTIEQSAESFASYVCQKVIPNPVSMSGIRGDNGKSRKLGLIWGEYHDTLEGRWAADEVRKRVRACGGHITAEGAFANGNGCHTRDYRHTPIGDLEVMTRFKALGVTTVLWPTCISTALADSAMRLQYHPEWVVLGDYEFDANGPVSAGRVSELFDQHAVIVTPATVQPPLHDRRCYEAMHTVDPKISDYDGFWSCPHYGQFRQLFSAIQVAGPALGPASMSRGIRSLPVVASTDPQTPTCSYSADDTTCVKDAMVMYWDASKPTRYNGASPTGCWRVLEGGRRYLPWTWPATNIDVARRQSDPCNDHDNDFDTFTRLPDRTHVSSGIPLIPETLP